MRTTVYLNTSRDASFGFVNKFSPARLRVGMRFNYDTGIGGASAANAEEIYTQLNVGGDLVPFEAYGMAWRAQGNRSLSVGDVIKFEHATGTRLYAVASCGYEEISVEQLNKALGANAFLCGVCMATGNVLQAATYVGDDTAELECGHTVPVKRNAAMR